MTCYDMFNVILLTLSNSDFSHSVQISTSLGVKESQNMSRTM